jgi:hypothetical protein
VNLAQVEKTYQERNSFRSTARIFGVSHVRVQRWLKKAQTLAPFKKSLRPPTPATVLQVDEVFTFVGLKVKQIRI